jgi:hypothetical protein
MEGKCRPLDPLRRVSIERHRPAAHDPGSRKGRTTTETTWATHTARRDPMPFPEGELLDSPGFAALRLPWVGDIRIHRLNPVRVRFTVR